MSFLRLAKSLPAVSNTFIFLFFIFAPESISMACTFLFFLKKPSNLVSGRIAVLPNNTASPVLLIRGLIPPILPILPKPEIVCNALNHLRGIIITESAMLASALFLLPSHTVLSDLISSLSLMVIAPAAFSSFICFNTLSIVENISAASPSSLTIIVFKPLFFCKADRLVSDSFSNVPCVLWRLTTLSTCASESSFALILDINRIRLAHLDTAAADSLVFLPVVAAR